MAQEIERNTVHHGNTLLQAEVNSLRVERDALRRLVVGLEWERDRLLAVISRARFGRTAREMKEVLMEVVK